MAKKRGKYKLTGRTTYERYVDEFNNELRKAEKYGLYTNRRAPVAYTETEFNNEIARVKLNIEFSVGEKAPKDLVKYLAKERVRTLSTLQLTNLMNNAFMDNGDGTFRFNDKVLDTMRKIGYTQTDINNLTSLGNNPSAHNRIYRLGQMLSEVYSLAKLKGLNMDFVNEGFWGS